MLGAGGRGPFGPAGRKVAPAGPFRVSRPQPYRLRRGRSVNPGCNHVENRTAGRPLLTFREAVLRTESGASIGPIDWTLYRGARIRLEAAAPEALQTLLLALGGRVTPVGGFMEELGTVVVQGDFLLEEAIAGNRTIQEYLHSPDAPEFVRMEGRRRAPGVLLDKLGLDPRHFRRPLKLEPADVRRRYLAFRLLVSRADLLLAREILEVDDPLVHEAFALRWDDIPGALVVAAAPERMPGATDAVVSLDGEGRFRLTVP